MIITVLVFKKIRISAIIILNLWWPVIQWSAGLWRNFSIIRLFWLNWEQKFFYLFQQSRKINSTIYIVSYTGNCSWKVNLTPIFIRFMAVIGSLNDAIVQIEKNHSRIDFLFMNSFFLAWKLTCSIVY